MFSYAFDLLHSYLNLSPMKSNVLQSNVIFSALGEIRVKSIDPEEVIERIFSPTGSGILPESIPLPQVVDILIDFWEADGLFD